MVEDLGRLSKRSGPQSSSLQDGSRIAVVGAGPAGSLFSYFLLNMAEAVSLDIGVDLFEPRHFCHRGPAGCNHCGGIVSESLVQRLATEGIMLPDGVVQRGIESYTLHMDVGDVEIETPLAEKRIAAIYVVTGREIQSLSIHTALMGICWSLHRRRARILSLDWSRVCGGKTIGCASPAPTNTVMITILL
jgi:hypothetical protein